MSIALVGAGYWGKNLVRDLYDLGALRAICDVDLNLLTNFKERFPQVEYCTDNWEMILEDQLVTAVVIALPAVMHYRFAKEALLAGKNVFVEKPLTLVVKEAEELVYLARERGKIIMVGHLLQYHPVIQKMYQLINKGYIGNIQYIVSNRLNLGKIRREENVLWSFAPHDISLILRLMGDELPESVTCLGQSFISDTVHDITTTVMRFAGGRYAQVNVNWLNPYKEQKLIVVGDKGMFTFDDTAENRLLYHANYLQWHKGTPQANNESVEAIKLDPHESYSSPLIQECVHFLTCLERGQVPLTDGEEGLRVLRVLDAAQRSLVADGSKILMSPSVNVLLDASPTIPLSEGVVIEERSTLHYMVHPTAVVDEGAMIGSGTKIWHFSHVSAGAEIGENCNIGQNVFIADGVKIGRNCKVQNNVSIYKGVIAGNNVFFGPSCVLTNDINPRAEYPKGGQYMQTIIEDGVTIGANATIVCGITLGQGAFVGAGAVVTKSLEPGVLVVGNPAQVIGFVDERGNRTLKS